MKDLSVVVVAGSGPNLLERAWLAELDMGWEKVNHMQASSGILQDILKET